MTTYEHWIIGMLITAVCALLLRWALHVESHAPGCDHDRARTKERVAALEDAVFKRGQTEEDL